MQILKIIRAAAVAVLTVAISAALALLFIGACGAAAGIVWRVFLIGWKAVT